MADEAKSAAGRKAAECERRFFESWLPGEPFLDGGDDVPRHSGAGGDDAVVELQHKGAVGPVWQLVGVFAGQIEAGDGGEVGAVDAEAEARRRVGGHVDQAEIAQEVAQLQRVDVGAPRHGPNAAPGVPVVIELHHATAAPWQRVQRVGPLPCTRAIERGAGKVVPRHFDHRCCRSVGPRSGGN